MDQIVSSAYYSAMLNSRRKLSAWAGARSGKWEGATAVENMGNGDLADFVGEIAAGGKYVFQTGRLDGAKKVRSVFECLTLNKSRVENPAAPDSQGFPAGELLGRLTAFDAEIARAKFAGERFEALLLAAKRLLSDIPAAPGARGVEDYSLFDETTLTAALSACVAEYRVEHPEIAALNEAHQLNEKMFLLYSCDFSGIQNFIFQVADSEAKRSLRARSFYLELLMEHFVDGLLEESGLCRANLLYAGGGHCYLILPNTKMERDLLERAARRENVWLQRKFGTLLFLASAWTPCSGRDLMNKPEGGAYSELFRGLSHMLGMKKCSGIRRKS